MTRRSEAAKRYRKLYKTKRWKMLRLDCLRRDNYQCQIRGHGCTINATVADHKVPHKGEQTLFFALTNLQATCKHCHDTHKQREERREYSGAVDDDGWPVDPDHPANRRCWKA